jgi:hypothetical protein
MALCVVTLHPASAFQWPETRLLAQFSNCQHRDWALFEAEPEALSGLEQAAGVEQITPARDGIYPTDTSLTWEVGGHGSWARVARPQPRPFRLAAQAREPPRSPCTARAQHPRRPSRYRAPAVPSSGRCVGAIGTRR